MYYRETFPYSIKKNQGAGEGGVTGGMFCRIIEAAAALSDGARCLAV